MVHDFYHRFIRPSAKERELVLLGRICTILLMLLACLVALYLESALDAFNLILKIGAGSGLLFILRWFWWRINAWTEIIAMISSFIMAILMHEEAFGPVQEYLQFICIVIFTTVCWLLTALMTKPTSEDVLVQFIRKIRPYKMGWKKIIEKRNIEDYKSSSIHQDIQSILLGSFSIYFLLFSTGYLLQHKFVIGFLLLIAGIVSLGFVRKIWINERRN